MKPEISALTGMCCIFRHILHPGGLCGGATEAEWEAVHAERSLRSLVVPLKQNGSTGLAFQPHVLSRARHFGSLCAFLGTKWDLRIRVHITQYLRKRKAPSNLVNTDWRLAYMYT